MKRKYIEITNELNESTQTKNCLCPMGDKVAGQRLQLLAGQFEGNTLPIYAERPIMESSIIQEMLVRSSCMQPRRGNIKVHAKFKFQDRTVYFYEHNRSGELNVFDNVRYTNNDEFATVIKTDLRLLDVGKEYDISSEVDNFMLKYINQYDPVSDTVGYGFNARTVITTNRHNAQDSISVSESFIRKSCTLKTKVVNINLANKTIISRYPEVFPKLGAILHSPFLFKMIKNNEGAMVNLAQDPNISAGYEDDNIILEPNSYINRVEVFCNEPIDNPHLEKLRKTLLDFRMSIASFLSDTNLKLDRECEKLLDNYSYSEFMGESDVMKDPLVIIHVKTISVPDLNCYKYTNLNGGKITVEYVYPDDDMIDEYGRTIEVMYPANSLINRAIAGVLYEIGVTGISEQVKHKVINNLITKKQLYAGVKAVFASLNLEEEFERFNPTEDELWKIMEIDHLRTIILPFSNDIDVPSMSGTYKEAREHFNHRKLKIFKKRSKGVYTEISEVHEVGMMFFMRLKHDPYHGSSGCSTPERDTRGYPLEKSTKKKDGRALYKDKAGKMSIMFLDKVLKTLSNEDIDILINDPSESGLYSVCELMGGMGTSLVSTSKVKNRQEVQEDEEEI